jgi:hypothetical protein
MMFLKQGNTKKLRSKVMNKRYRDEIALVTHDIMKDFQQVGAVSEAEMQEFEQDCLVHDTDSPQETSEPQKTKLHTPITA